MTQSLLTIVLFIGLMAAMPFAIRRLQQKRALPLGPSGPACKLISALAVGPQQRILTVEVGPEGARSWLVVGVSAQGITPLHTVAAPEPLHVAQ
ncbi:flagellar biosynthetic protein FliO [Xenophilus arseniciresistens]|uniref:Flagellar biosynthetic protein FliO n=1 Tax=Xenophilus arseniciresistens TaxID=1283306 RepID=A0AAE3N651_9BURK|nr:flagellar biosynthetic protein FliO [Xenophilus arseniciresistens]MDA7415224.1 flagellar biosynthetic protein FliO [Xenophilus arseniciresistens]